MVEHFRGRFAIARRGKRAAVSSTASESRASVWGPAAATTAGRLSRSSSRVATVASIVGRTSVAIAGTTGVVVIRLAAPLTDGIVVVLAGIIRWRLDDEERVVTVMRVGALLRVEAGLRIGKAWADFGVAVTAASGAGWPETAVARTRRPTAARRLLTRIPARAG